MIDAAVVGGGPAGCAAAIALRAAGLAVTLVDQGRPGAGGVGQALPAAAAAELARLGVWDGAPPGGLASAGVRSAWAQTQPRWRDGFADPLGGGWVIDRAVFDSALRKSAAAVGVSVLGRSRVTGACRGPAGQWSLSVQRPDGAARRLAAGFLVDASGRAAVLARRHARRHIADHLVCVFARLAGPGVPSLRHALIESAEHGWWYAAGLPGGDATVAFFSDADLVRGLGAARPAGWHRLLRQAGGVFDALARPGPPARLGSAAASSGCLLQACGDGWVAAGDAGAAWDPLASAGVTMALRSGLAAAGAALAARGGDAAALAGYAAGVSRRHTRYLLERRGYYQLEARWPDSAFWRRRAA